MASAYAASISGSESTVTAPMARCASEHSTRGSPARPRPPLRQKLQAYRRRSLIPQGHRLDVLSQQGQQPTSPEHSAARAPARTNPPGTILLVRRTPTPQNVPFCAPPTGRAGGVVPVQSGGSARGYLAVGGASQQSWRV